LSDSFFAADSPLYHVFLSNQRKAITADPDAKIDRIYFDFPQIASTLNLISKPESLQTSGKKYQKLKTLIPCAVAIPGFSFSQMEQAYNKETGFGIHSRN
jgi:hypothetical protein